MANVTVNLSREDVYRAVSEYAEKYYPINTKTVRIETDGLGRISSATVNCEIKKDK